MPELVEFYKEVMSYWPSGVTIVTSEFEGQHYGMTVSSFTSVSLHPAMISVCIDKRTQMCSLLQNSNRLGISILGRNQKELAKTFANHELSMLKRFEKASFSTSQTKSPVLENALGWLDCSIHSYHDTGDHIIYVGLVEKAKSLSEGDPVIYYRRGWHHLA